jgi:type II secretory pathway pseudopilin PulG
MQSGKRCHQRGFGYLMVLFTLAAMGLLLAGAGQVWHTVAQREREADLLFVGNQFRRAIGSYYQRTPDAVKQYPKRLEDLLEDHRHPVPLRHLRMLYRDPVTGSAEWGLVKNGDRIVGVHSLATASPLKSRFLPRDAAFDGSTSYDQWVFSHNAAGVAP